jgi:deoxyribodipyrimidine photo-lyase
MTRVRVWFKRDRRLRDRAPLARAAYTDAAAAVHIVEPACLAGAEPSLAGTDRGRFKAWCTARTDAPMVDACMRSLRATGWLNFRMRAMRVSLAAHHLWLQGRAPGQFLARQFVDFEPGIHWSRMQMQSGTTGFNMLRICSPATQARDHDPNGVFVRHWVPDWGTPAYPAPPSLQRERFERVGRATRPRCRASPAPPAAGR